MSDTRIASVAGRRVWDSRGRPTVEAEVVLACGAAGRAIAPAGASRGSGEACDLRDGGEHLDGYDVRRAVSHVNGEIRQAIVGRDAAGQDDLDRALVDLDGTPDASRLGGNALIAVSIAVAQAAAAAAGAPLWRYLAGDAEPLLPLPQVQIFGGGAHAGGRIDIQDVMAVPLGAGSFDDALQWAARVYMAAGNRMAEAGRLHGVADEGGYWPAFSTNEEALQELVRAVEDAGFVPGEEVAVALDVAASQFFHDGRYRLGLDERSLDADALCEMLTGWLDRYPIVSLEDPLAENDDEGMRRFTRAAGDRVQIVGDDYLVTDPARITAAAAARACNAVLLKPNQAATLSAARAALEAARAAGFGTIASARSGESEDVSIVHLAVAWRTGQIKVGAFSRSERMAKWNEGLRIEQALAERARYAGASALGPYAR